MTEPAESGHPAPPEAAAHLSPPSWWPLTMAIGVVLTLTGLVVNRIMMAVGVVLGLASLGLWVRAVRREYTHLEE